MKKTKMYIPFVYRCIAYVLLISQLLFSCGSPIQVTPQPHVAGMQRTERDVDVEAAEALGDEDEEDDDNAVPDEPTAAARAGACLRRCGEATHTCLRRCRRNATPVVNEAGRRISLAGEAIRPMVSNVGTHLSLAGEAARPVLGRASQRLSVVGSAARASMASMANRAASTSCGERILFAKDFVGNALFMLKYNLEHIHDAPAPYVDSDEEPIAAHDEEPIAAPDPEQQSGILDEAFMNADLETKQAGKSTDVGSSSTEQPQGIAPATDEGTTPVTSPAPTARDIEERLEGTQDTDETAIPNEPSRCVVMSNRVKEFLRACPSRCVMMSNRVQNGARACHKGFKRQAHKANVRRTKVIALSVTTAALAVTAYPHFWGFWVDDTGCKNPLDCTIATDSFALRVVAPTSWQEAVNTKLHHFIQWHQEKEKQLGGVWYQQQPCALLLLQENNATDLYQVEGKAQAYLNCRQTYGAEIINTTEGLWQYLAQQSRENTEKLDTDSLDATGRTIVTELNKNTQMNLGEGVRLQAQKMGELIQETEQFKEGVLGKMKEDTTTQVTAFSWAWHVTARMQAFAAALQFLKVFAFAAATTTHLRDGIRKEVQLRYNSNLLHPLNGCFAISTLLVPVYMYMKNREIFEGGSAYTISPTWSVLSDTILLRLAFMGLNNINLYNNGRVERAAALFSLVSTAIWMPKLISALQVHVTGMMNCHEPGSLPALATTHNNLLNMLQVITSGVTKPIMEMVMPGMTEQFQQAHIDHTQLPDWCASNAALESDLASNAKLMALDAYLVSMLLSPVWSLAREYTRNLLVFFALMGFYARCVLAYNQSLLTVPFVHVSRSVPRPGFLEALCVAIVLSSAISIETGKIVPDKTEEEAEKEREQEQAAMQDLQSDGTVMGNVRSMMMRGMSSLSSVSSQASEMAAQLSDRFQRQFSGF